MSIWLILLIASGIVPLARAIWANRRTTLLHALAWGVAAWAAWLWLAITGTATAGYFASSLTACAGVAVLGARRPGVGAWNAVVGALYATLLFPLAQEFLMGESWFDRGLVGIFAVWVVPGVGLLNYVETRLGLGAVCLFTAGALARVAGSGMYHFFLVYAIYLAGISPWVAWGMVCWRRRFVDDGTRLWRDFRNRFGLIWALRVQEQFNLAATNAGLPVVLTWNRLIRMDATAPQPGESAAAYKILVALMKRFGLP